jgi:hypothetical protein
MLGAEEELKCVDMTTVAKCHMFLEGIKCMSLSVEGECMNLYPIVWV